MSTHKNKKGFILAGVMIVLVVLMIIVPIMVKWVQNDTKISVKDQKSSLAFALAEAALDRGYWKVKGSTSTFAEFMAGNTLAGYNFDVKYTDISGGDYRIHISSGPGEDQVTILGEGRDSQNKETRSIQAVYTNTSVPGAIIAGGMMSATGSSVVHWGPIMAMGDITVTGAAANSGFPRKLSRQTVLPSTRFDPTGDTNPPNTDSLEWWSNYNVPELPVFDFTTMRDSAAATGTLNCDNVTITSTTYETIYNPCIGSGCTDPGPNCSCSNVCSGLSCVDSGGSCSCTNQTTGSACVDSGRWCSCTGSGSSRICTGDGCTDSDGAGPNCVRTNICTGSGCTDSDGGDSGCVCGNTCTGIGCADTGPNCDCTTSISTNTSPVSGMHCCSSAYLGGPVTCSYGGSGCTNCSVNNFYDETSLRDEDYTWYWDNNVDWTGKNGLRGTIIVRGNLGITGGDYYCSNCALEVPPAAWQEYQKIDTSASNQYPGDIGNHSNAATYTMGSCSSTCEGGPLGADLGVYGFLYVGGDFNRSGDSDIYGAMWVVGDVSGTGNTMLFYNSNLRLPTLNVVLTKESWEEKPPSAQAWP